MLYLFILLFSANIFAQPAGPDFQEDAVQKNILQNTNTNQNQSNKLFTENYFQDFTEVYFEEDFSNLQDLYDFRDTEDFGIAPVCAQNKNLRSPKMLYNKDTQKIYLLINPYVQIDLRKICSNYQNETWTIPIKSDFKGKKHHYPYIKTNDDKVPCQSTGPKVCKKLYYKTIDGGEIDTRARIKINKTGNNLINFEISGASLRLLVNSINNNSSKVEKIKLNILCYHNGEKTILNPFKETLFYIKGSKEENLSQNIFINNYKSNCEWYK